MKKEDRSFFAAYARFYNPGPAGERAAQAILNQCDDCDGRGWHAEQPYHGFDSQKISCAVCDGTGRVD